jgi:hypothetical protein
LDLSEKAVENFLIFLFARLAQRQIDFGISEKLGGWKDGWMIPIIS